MELGELRVFLTVASERSFSRAAAKLYRSQPAISQAVRRLEDQLGEPLFDRTMKQGALTPAGEVLFREGTRLLRLAEETAAAVRRQSEQDRGIIRIGADEAAVHALMPAIALFASERPGMSVELRRLSETEIVEEVADGAIDVGAVTSDRVPARFQQLRLALPASGITALIAATHRYAACGDVAVPMLDDERVIVLGDLSHLHDRVMRALTAAGGAPAAVMRVPSIDALTRAVEMGLGVGIVPTVCASARGHGVAAAPLSGVDYRGTVTLVYRENEALSRSTATFVGAVRHSVHPS